MGVMHVRRLTTQEWADQNPIVSVDQLALDTVTEDFRIGDGKTRWSKLPNYTRRASGGSEDYSDLAKRVADLEDQVNSGNIL